MASSNPGRPPAVRDLMLILNGAPMFPPFPGLSTGQQIPSAPSTFPYSGLMPAPGSGILTSTGTAVNNITTATPFAAGGPTPSGPFALPGSMAGRAFYVQATAAGFLMPSDSPLVGNALYWTVATNVTIPPTAGTFPGIQMQANDVRELIMGQTTGWLQWISTTGTASLICTEIF